MQWLYLENVRHPTGQKIIPSEDAGDFNCPKLWLRRAERNGIMSNLRKSPASVKQNPQKIRRTVRSALAEEQLGRQLNLAEKIQVESPESLCALSNGVAEVQRFRADTGERETRRVAILPDGAEVPIAAGGGA